MEVGGGRFDAGVWTMALMDMETIAPLVDALSRVLKPGAHFVFTVCHPCFNSPGCAMVMEKEERDGELKTVHSIKVSKYLQPWTEKGVAIVGEPVGHYLFNRPLSLLFSTCFRAGFVLDGIEEPTDSRELSEAQWFSWANYKEIPPVLVARMRLSLP